MRHPQFLPVVPMSLSQQCNMSQSETRLAGKPPPRLSWPASFVVGNNDKTKNGRKRQRNVELWVDKFAPSTSADLCVAPKKISECRDWIREATDPTPTSPSKKLLVLVGAPGCGKSTMVRVLANELNLQVHSWNESFVARTPNGMQLDHVLSVEHSSALDTFQEFLVQCGAGFRSLNLTADEGTGLRRSIILLEELPNLYGLEAENRFRSIMTQHFHETQVPTILVFSDVSEGKHKPGDMERLIDPKILYSQSSLICQVHPVTKPKMKKIIERIARQENFKVSPTLVEDLHLQSRGDIRHALMTLQVQSCDLRSTSRSIHRSGLYNDRDTKLSTFHMLGKLLYAKRTLDVDGNSRLAFDPEEILELSDMGVRASLQFLEYHSTEFFTDIEDLGQAFSLFSDAAILLDNPENSYEQNPIFPEGCASSIAGRAVARTNRHPTPKKFRQLSSPKVFEVLRKRRHNQSIVLALAQKLSGCHLSPSTAVAGSQAFVTELLPTLRLILPDVVNPSVENFYSVARESIENDGRAIAPSQENVALEIQQELLQMDDIQDFDSDSEGYALKAPSTTPMPLISSLERRINLEEQSGSPNVNKESKIGNVEVIVIDDSD